MPPRKKQYPFGDLDGERVDTAVAKLAGEHTVDRKFDEGERLLVVGEVTVGAVPGFKRKDGRLVRVEKFTVSHLIVIEDQEKLISDINKALDADEEKRTGAAKLPLEDD